MAKILLGVTGGIAAYKSCELVRLLKKAGHEVRVLMSANAENFVGALTFESLSGNKVLRSLQTNTHDLSATSHIDLAAWGDIFVVAPATANFLAKYACGIADDALLTESLAFTGPVVLAPAMNTRMWEAPATRENCERLTKRGVHWVGPESGDLACGETGAGKMSEPSAIFARVEEIVSAGGKPLSGLRVLVTSGPTRSYLDSIRFITNRSSGRMGHAIAQTAEALGADVTLVSGPVEKRFASLVRGKVVPVETTSQMAKATLEAFPRADIVIATAAVADFEAPQVASGKLPRAGTLELKLSAAPDIIAEVGRQRSSKQVLVGFAAEFGEGPAELQKAREKLERKNLDLLAFNNVSRSDIGFDVDENEILLFRRGQERPEQWQKLSKRQLAEKLLLEALRARRP